MHAYVSVSVCACIIETFISFLQGINISHLFYFLIGMYKIIESSILLWCFYILRREKHGLLESMRFFYSDATGYTNLKISKEKWKKKKQKEKKHFRQKGLAQNCKGHGGEQEELKPDAQSNTINRVSSRTPPCKEFLCLLLFKDNSETSWIIRIFI